MTTSRIAPVIAALFALAASVSAQGGVNPPIGRLGLEPAGGEPARLVPPVTPFATPEKEKRPKGPTEITAKEATFDSRIHLGTFSEDVVVHDPEFGLSCDKLTVNMKKPPEAGAAKSAEKTTEKTTAKPKESGEASSGIEKATAEGNVIITQDKPDPATGKLQRYTGKGNRAVFDNTTGTLTLYGWPQISQTIAGSLSKQIISREQGCVIILNRAGKIEVKGSHTSTLHDSGDVNPGR
jgi:lipopolysaccharide export system protein LptA